MTAVGSKPLRVEIALDLTCVHSYLGFNRFQRVAARHRAAGGGLDVVFLPFQVSPEAPPEGRPLSEVHLAFFGSAEQAARATAGMAAVGAQDGLELNFERAVHVNTFEAHRLLATAAHQGLGEPMAERLFRAYLTEGLNIGDRAVLDRLAAETGVRPTPDGAEELRAELTRVRALGISSVPQFRFTDTILLAGAQPEEALQRAFEAAAAGN
ncbi:DsbA family oxidoreductase [Streptomyces lanatus]|uniref:DsbA family oxidoreductase n=1 Tax=Streptomyces lanatus TaxID=66900 RepID=A0ABV1Y6V9_9ACTN|nr:DsbA family oxidoreductase [Streptomyces lanatus]GHH30531.1 dithiol-disulfide isomerase [Streptomyces lanatus]